MKNLFFLFLLVTLFACEKTPTNGVPNVYVNIALDLNSPSFQALNAVGGAVQITGGAKGIIVYRFSQDEYLAYDRTCTYLPDRADSRVGLDSTLINAVDSSCGSKFELNSGSALKGPASAPLQRYITSLNETGNTLYIKN